MCNRYTKLRNLLVVSLFFLLAMKSEAGEGKCFNPITDVCWDCLFPMTISGVNVTPKTEDLTVHQKKLCHCAGTPPKAGVPISFWEPKYLVEVTRHPYKMVAFGGVSLAKGSYKNRGTIGLIGEGPSQYSFYQVHLYKFPVLSLLNLLTDFKCIEKGEWDLGFISELDPLWNDEEWSAVFNPEATLFSSSLAQLTCVADCIASSFNKPLDALFWCGGCLGSLYPFTGFVGHHVSGTQASSLLVQRVLAKLHRILFLKGFAENNFCEAEFMPILKKSLYKTQLIFPKTQRKGPCHALGKTDLLWGMGNNSPIGGEDFVYMVWAKNQCCLDAVKPAASTLIGGFKP